MDYPGHSASFGEPFDPGRSEIDGVVNFYFSLRLDSLLPLDPDLGVVSPVPTRVYLGAAMEMVSRSAQPLSLLAVAMDARGANGPAGKSLDTGGAGMIAQAVARCLRQETRLHDVVGMLEPANPEAAPIYLIVCPLLDETHAAQLGERLRAVMMSFAADPGDLGVQTSIGVAAQSLSTVEPESLISHAVDALRRARRVEGGCVWRHSDTPKRLFSDDDDTPRPEPGCGAD
jgi:GGDEF domain-containing protein